MDNALSKDLDYILNQTIGLWDELRGERIFITGGTGFFGCWLLESFIWANDHLKLDATAVVLTRDKQAFQDKAPHLACHPAIQFYQGDVRSFGYPEGPFKYIIHAAASSSARLNKADPLTNFETIVKGTWRLLEFARRSGTRKLLFTSSGAVYGKQPPTITHIPEDYLGAPDLFNTDSSYGEGKRAAELLCTLFGKRFDIEAKIARCFAFVGPYLPLDEHYAIGNFIRDSMNGGPIEIKGDGSPYRSYLYAADLMIWLWNIFLQGKKFFPYNVGSEEEITIVDLAKTVSGMFQPPVKIKIAFPPEKGKIPERYVPSTLRTRSQLQLNQTISLRDAISKTIHWHQECS